MSSMQAIEQRLAWHRAALAGWRELDGYLVPTEPDADARQRIREYFNVAIHELTWVLDTLRTDQAEPISVTQGLGSQLPRFTQEGQ